MKNLKIAEAPILNLFAGLLSILLLTACTAHYMVNTQIPNVQAVDRYYLRNQTGSQKSDELLLILTFSGGGTRAAALSYGVLKALAETQVVVGGRQLRLLDEVDVISSVSGGSFTSAYYGLFGDRILEDFESKFLKRDVESELALKLIAPSNWSKLASTYYDRSDLVAEYFDEVLFEGKTFGDFQLPRLPLIAINATDIALGSQFTFLGEQFAPICADLSSYPVSRAVTASAAIPGPFSTIVLKNYAGTCDYQLPEWAAEATREDSEVTRRYQNARILSSYLDVEKYAYIHLFDGGLSDNLGVRFILNYTAQRKNIWQQMHSLGLHNTDKLAIIVINARGQVQPDFARQRESAPIIGTFGVISSIPLDRYSFDTLDLLRREIKGWEKSITAVRCKKGKTGSDSPDRNCSVKTYLIEVTLDQTPDEIERQHLLNLPTSFHLEADAVDRIKAAARDILSASDDFQRLVSDLQ